MMSHQETAIVAANRIDLADANKLSLLMQKVIDLKNAEPRDDLGVVRPTDHAFDRTLELLIGTEASLKTDWDLDMPYGCVSPDFEGGVRIDWFRSDSSVALTVPAALGGQHYIYHDFSDGHGIDDDVTAQCLARWLVKFDEAVNRRDRGEVKIDSIR